MPLAAKLSTAIQVSPSDAALLGLYFTPVQERAAQIFSSQPRVQLLDKFGNPVCNPPNNENSVKVRVCHGEKRLQENESFPSNCLISTEVENLLVQPGAYFIFSGLYTNRTGINYLFFLAGSLSNSSVEMNVASGIPSEIVIIQSPRTSVAEELILTSQAPPFECQECVPEETVGVKILDVAGNDLTEPASVWVEHECEGCPSASALHLSLIHI